VTDRRDGRARLVACTLAAVAGVALVAVTYHPGLITADSAIQLREARALAPRDWHPPLMGWVWAGLDRIVPGTLGMMLFTNAIFWSGLGLTVYVAALSPLASAAAILAIGLMPPVFSALGVIWKDVTLAALLQLAFALSWWADTRRSRRALLPVVALLACAAAWRHNGIIAVLPLAFWVPFIAWRDRRDPRWLRPLAGVALFALLTAGVLILNRALAIGGRLFPAQQLLIHDLAGISVESGRVRLPVWLRTEGPVTLEALRCVYTPGNVSDLFSAKRGSCPLRISKIFTAERLRVLRRDWLRTVAREPRAYLAHRWAVFREQFAIGTERVCVPLHVHRSPDDLGLQFAPTRLYEPLLMLHARAAYDSPLFRGWWYLMVLVAVLVMSVRASVVPAAVLASSGLVYGLAYLIVGSACPFRLHWWCVVAACAAVFVLAAGTRRVTRPP
jgi:hypothetical protein